jgi:hypothetical protein
MVNKGKSFFYLVIAIFLVSQISFAEKPTALFLLDAKPNTRLYSMGGVFSGADYGDAFSNPATLGWSVVPGASLSTWQGKIENSRYNFLATVSPYLMGGRISLSYLSYNTGSDTIEELDGSMRSVTFEKNTVVGLGYGFRLSQVLFTGLGLKYLSSTLAEDYTATSILADFGLLYRTLDDKHSLEASIINYGKPLKYLTKEEQLPTELRFGYSYKQKPFTNSTLITSLAFSRVIADGSNNISAGAEFFPGTSLFCLRAGIMKGINRNLEWTTGLGLRFGSLDIDAGYMLKTADSQDISPYRFSLNWHFGSRDPLGAGQEYLKQGMRNKALAVWDNIKPYEKNYADAQSAIKLYMDPPVLEVGAGLADTNLDRILSGGEEGEIVVDVVNKGKSPAINIRADISLSDMKAVYNSLWIGPYNKTIESIPPGGSAEIRLPVKANEEVDVTEIPFDIRIVEGRGFNPQPMTFYLQTKPYPPPQPVMAKYTFREDNTGNSIGNGNGMIEKGEQVEITGIIVNAGESVARKVAVSLKSNDPGIQLIEGASESRIGDLSPGESKKVVFAFKVLQNYSGPAEIPLSFEIKEERQKYSSIKPLNIALGEFYRTPISPIITSNISINLPDLPGPIPGNKADEIIKAAPGELPSLKFSAAVQPDANNNGMYEPGEKISIGIDIRNTGRGTASGVKVLLSGDDTITALLGSSKEVGDILPGESRLVLFENIVPESIVRKTADFTIRVSESKGFEPVSIDKSIAFMPKKAEIAKSYPNLLPWPEANKGKREKSAALIIGISDYQSDKIDDLKYAKKDAEIVKEYFNGVLGIPEKNIKILSDSEATTTKIKTLVEKWLAKGDYEFIAFYFAGHGLPDPKGSDKPFIVPSDSDLSDPDLEMETIIPVNELVSALEKSSAKDILVVLDSCFSGAGGRTPKSVLLAQRGIVRTPKFKQERAIVFSAALDQSAMEFDKVEHGYFTYYVLLGLKGAADSNKDGIVTSSELCDFVKTNLEEELGGKQTPLCDDSHPLELGRWR